MAKPSLHYHGCVTCKDRYPDACATPKVNATCQTCRSGRRSIHAMGSDPHECCPRRLRLCNKDDLKVYKLAGPGPWWICQQCARQFAYDVRITRAA